MLTSPTTASPENRHRRNPLDSRLPHAGTGVYVHGNGTILYLSDFDD